MRITIFILLLMLSFTLKAQTKADSLYVFVGEKIEVNPFEPELPKGTIQFDSGVKAKYRVIRNVFGKYSKDTIEFMAYDHYGAFGFAKYKYALLYVSNIGGKLYHQKYQFTDVYLTKDGRWAGPYQAGLYSDPRVASTSIKPENIDFADEVSFSLKQEFLQSDRYDEAPSPYFKIENGRAVAVMGNYVEQLFEMKKITVLKERGLF